MNTTIRQLEQTAIEALAPLYEREEALLIARHLLEELLQTGQTALLLLDKDTALSEHIRQSFGDMLARLGEGEPLQYVLGYTYFYGLRVSVAPGVLIPRPETEELVELVRLRSGHLFEASCLDIGTGSGCIAMGLGVVADDRPWRIEALEHSPEALEVARANFEALRRERGIEIHPRQGDLFRLLDLPPTSPYDIIVSNPPYIAPEEAREMLGQVLDHEPHEALFAPEGNAIAYYEEIARLASDSRWLGAGGMVFLEINPLFAGATTSSLREIIGSRLERLELLTDMSGKERFVILKVR